MKDLENRLRWIKPAVPDLPADFSDRVMTAIEALDASPSLIRQRTRRGGALAGGVLLLLLGAVLANSALFEIKMSGAVEMLAFGRRLLGPAFSLLPMDLIIASLMATGLAALLLRYSRFLRTALWRVVIGSYLFTAISGTSMAASNLNEQLQRNVLTSEESWPLVSRFYEDRARYQADHPRFRMGRVIKRQGNIAWLETPQGKRVTVRLSPSSEIALGDYLRAIGEIHAGTFEIEKYQPCHPRRVERYWCHMDMGGGNMMHHRMPMHRGMMQH